MGLNDRWKTYDISGCYFLNKIFWYLIYVCGFSWTCVRSQIQDKSSSVPTAVVMPTTGANVTWCDGADEWDENDNDTANGNFMNVDNAPSPKNGIQR